MAWPKIATNVKIPFPGKRLLRCAWKRAYWAERLKSPGGGFFDIYGHLQPKRAVFILKKQRNMPELTQKEQISMYWLEEWQNYDKDYIHGPVTTEGIKGIINLKLLIDDTIGAVVDSKADLIPWLKTILPSEERLNCLPDKEKAREISIKTDIFLKAIAELLEDAD